MRPTTISLLGTAALLCGAYVPAPDERIGVIISGGNTAGVSFDRAQP